MSGDGLRVFPVTYSQTKPFLLSVHYARRMPNIRYAFGLFDGWDLIGVCTFGSPASPPLCKGLAGEENHKHVLELNRLAFLPGKNGMNHASILVGRSLRMLPHGTFVVSFADWGGWHHVGYVYQATNWLYTGLTKARTDLAGVGGGALPSLRRRRDKKGAEDGEAPLCLPHGEQAGEETDAEGTQVRGASVSERGVCPLRHGRPEGFRGHKTDHLRR